MDVNEYTSYCLKGKEKLWKVFWLWFVAVVTFLAVVFKFAAPYALANDSFMENWLQWVFLVLLVYGIWIMMALWRCAFNATWKGWGYMVRLMVAGIVGIVGLAILMMFMR